jgi:hypothetical protein
MATTTSKKRESAKQVAIDVLRDAGEPLHAKEIGKRMLASGRCAGLKGKTPEATISAMLAVGSTPGGPFTRVDKGTYTLADSPDAAVQPAQPEPAAKSRGPATPKQDPAAKAGGAPAREPRKRPTTEPPR